MNPRSLYPNCSRRMSMMKIIKLSGEYTLAALAKILASKLTKSEADKLHEMIIAEQNGTANIA